MRYSVLRQVAATLVGLSGTAAGMGMTVLRRELRLAAEMGINPNFMVKSQQSVHKLAKQADLSNVVAKTVSVRSRTHSIIICVLGR